MGDVLSKKTHIKKSLNPDIELTQDIDVQLYLTEE